LFNHESERRGIEFVTRKITDGVARIHLGLQDKITLGNLDAKRDWGYAPDYVEAMWLILQQDEPGDYVISTGETHSIKEFLDLAFQHIGITDWKNYVEQNPRFMRPAEVDLLRGDSTKAYDELGWKPKTSFEDLVGKMVKGDIEKIKNETR
jgi:GDPmannose 4,6-dehydratase